MDRIAFIIGETFVYWNAIIMTLAVATAICLFLGLYIGKTGKILGAAVVLPLAISFSMVFARAIHWYCRADSYDSLQAALTNLTGGGYALMGVFAGCALAALIVRLLRIIEDLPEMLDCMSIAAAGSIAVGRLACFFNASDRGQILEGVQSLPWVYPVTNPVSGAIEYRLATFVLQAGVTGILFAVLLVFFLVGALRRKLRSGDTALLFILAYGASQVVLDSTRYDSLFFRSNGFVSIVQVLGAVGIALAIVIFSVRMVRNMGFRKWHIALWVALAGMLGGAGYMEYHVQRHGSEAAFAYSVMSACLVGIVLTTVAIRLLAVTGQKAKTAPARHAPSRKPQPKFAPQRSHTPRHSTASHIPVSRPEPTPAAPLQAAPEKDAPNELDINVDEDWDAMLRKILSEE